MIWSANNLNQIQGERFVDIHCHCLSDIDDGPASMPESIELCKALAADGIGTVIATPHQLGRFDNSNSSEQIRDAVNQLNEELKVNEIDLEILPGGDVRIDERICQLINEDKVMTAADGKRYLMLELVSEVLINIEPLLSETNRAGLSVIISHPERYRIVSAKPEIIEKWLERGVSLQITAGSLLGEFGSTAKEASELFLAEGWISFIATDAHDVYLRRPCMRAAYELIAEKAGVQTAKELCIENPQRVIRGEDLAEITENRIEATRQNAGQHQENSTIAAAGRRARDI
ncbi:MAG: CpsB/CapC family capsule biosynthesis tyrosine phosphatase [Phycisphaerae bacterium]|jgi:protein-tyrosine phosphatase